MEDSPHHSSEDEACNTVACVPIYIMSVYRMRLNDIHVRTVLHRAMCACGSVNCPDKIPVRERFLLSTQQHTQGVLFPCGQLF